MEMDMEIPGIAGMDPVEAMNYTPYGDGMMMDGIQGANVEQAGGYLGKDEFLKLLVTQLQYQDPLDPMDNAESIAQLAQFSALEQMQNVAEQVESLRHASGLVEGLFLQGQHVEARALNGAELSGLIERVSWGQNGIMLTIGGETVAMKHLAELRIMEAADNGDDDHAGEG